MKGEHRQHPRKRYNVFLTFELKEVMNKFYPILVAHCDGHAIEAALSMHGYRLRGDAAKILDTTQTFLDSETITEHPDEEVEDGTDF